MGFSRQWPLLVVIVIMGAALSNACGGNGTTCSANESTCGGACTDTSHDTLNCGSCGNACAAGQICSQGACVPTCAAGTTTCSGVCVDTQIDPQNCGSCGSACKAGMVCSKGSCATSCGGGTTLCGSKCADTNVDPGNCGGCGKVCAAAQTCAGGMCKSGCPGTQMLCAAGGDAGGDGAAAVCVDPQTDSHNCGACNNACAQGQVCAAGNCSTSCQPSETLCTPDAAPPYCANTQTDGVNCGSCGNTCGNGQTCSSGKCGANCGAGETLCTPDGGAPYCADEATDNANCGACGNVCSQGQVCSNGFCGVTCSMGLTQCGNQCVDTTSDHDDCGGCGTVCQGSSTCVGGVCAHHVFVSSATYTGNLGGLVGADTKCQTLASTAGLPGIYRAWLSDGTNGAATRLTHSTQPYVLSDGKTVVANDWTGLTSGTLLHAIDLTETGQPPPNGNNLCMNSTQVVFTDTTIAGAVVAAADSCSAWTSASVAVSSFGLANATNGTWTNACAGAGNCAATAAIYCVQQ